VTALPIVIHVVTAIAITNSVAARRENTVVKGIGPWTAAIYPAITRVVAIDEFAALPILVST
jgi:hypothetical protein